MAPANLCTPYYEPGGRLTFEATGAVTGKRFINPSANRDAGPALNTDTGGGNIKCAHASANGQAVGVAEFDVASGSLGSMIATPGAVVPVTADGAISAGARVMVGTAGKAKAAATGGIPVGVAMSGASDGADCQVQLFTAGTVLA